MTRSGRLAATAVIVIGVTFGLGSDLAGQATHDVTNTPHNLSASGGGGPNNIDSTESEICAFCHTPHGASLEEPPLWNRTLTSAGYVPYSSPSVQSAPGQPTGDSKLCLSCHDGSIALGELLNLRGTPANITMAGTGGTNRMPTGSTLIGTNLLNDHPVSFTYDAGLQSADGELVNPFTLTDDILLREGSTAGVADEVQCTTCHDAHEQARPKFLRKDLKGRLDNLCLACHDKPGWSGSTHEGSSEYWPAAQTTEMVQDHSCVACHSPHTESGAERLLRSGASGGESAIEQTCYQCHTASGSGGISQDIQAQFSKSSAHPIALNPGGHKPVFLTRGSGPGLPENVLLSPGVAAEDASYTDVDHVECVDCHNPHRVTAANRTEGMRGIGIDGSEISSVVNDPAPANSQPSSTQYPVCLRCHGDTYDDVIGTAPLASGAIPGNKRVEFNTNNSSFHPVAGPGKNTSSRLNQQLTGQGLSTSSVIKCTDCHNSNAYENDTGRMRSTGTTAANPVGPHGSTYQSILRAPYWNQLPGPSSWNANNFKLCFRCHSATRLLSDSNGSEFDDQVDGRDNLHNVHLDDRSDKAGAICQSCHYNIHSNQESTTTQYNVDGVVTNTPPTGVTTALINFHPNVRGIGGRPRPEWWYRSSDQERRCYLQCHTIGGGTGGETMNGLPYGPG